MTIFILLCSCNELVTEMIVTSTHTYSVPMVVGTFKIFLLLVIMCESLDF